MEIHNNYDSGMKSVSGLTPATSTTPQARSASYASGNSWGSDSATLSNAGVSMSSGDSDVRMDKVTAVQSALASGSYSAPTSVVASRLVDSMLS